LTAKALVDAWPRLIEYKAKPSMRPYDLTPEQQVERDRERAEERRILRRNKIQRQIALDIIDEHGGEQAEDVASAYALIRPPVSDRLCSFSCVVRQIAEQLAPGEIDKRLDEMRKTWLRRQQAIAYEIIERKPGSAEEAWIALQKKKPLGMKKDSTIQQWLGVVADMVSPGELAKRMEADDESE